MEHEPQTLGAFGAADNEPDEYAARFRAAAETVAEEAVRLLVAKHESYGRSALEPLAVFGRGDAETLLRARIDDKLSRIAARAKYGDEDTVLDLIGYLVLLRIHQRRLV